MESKSSEDPVKDVPEAAVEVESAPDGEEEIKPSLEVKPTADDDGESVAAGDSANTNASTANKEDSEEPKDRRPSSEEEEEKNEDEPVTGPGEDETKTDEATSKVESVASPREEDEPEEKFEDAVDSEEKLPKEEAATESLKDSLSEATLTSVPSSSALKMCSSSEQVPTLEIAESYEIEDSPEKPPNKPATPSSVAKPRPLPSSSSTMKQLSTVLTQLTTIKSPEIETVDLDDDDDDDDEDEYDDEEVATAAAVRDDYDDEEDDFEEDDEDDYYEDPESDDQDVSQVLQGALDEMNAIDDPESGEDDKMDVSSDEDDYSEDDDQPSVVVPRSALSSKRKRGDDYLEEGEVYDNEEEDADEPEEDEDDDDDVEEVIELDGREGRRKGSVSMGQISVEDESEEEVVVQQQKKKSRRVKYKSYRQKVMARIRRRTYKLLNKRSMHVMEEGSDALVCSDATKIVSLKSAVSSVGAKATTAAEEVSIKDPKSKEDQTITPGEVERKDSSEVGAVVVASGDAAKVVSECKKDDENKENMTVKDNAKEVPRRVEVDEKAKAKDEEKVEKKDRKQEQSEDDELPEGVMDSIDEIVADAKKQNGSKSDFNEELTFQMDVEESEKDFEEDEDDHEEDEEDEDDEEEEGAVDLSSSYDANKSDRQTDDSDAIEMIDSSPEKDSSVVGIKTTRKPEALQLDKAPSDSRKVSPEKVATVVKQEVEDDSERIQESTKESTVSASKSSPSREEKQSEKSRKAEAVSRKRRRSVDPDDREEDGEPLVPSKKLKRELESNYPTHDRLLKEYIETTSNHSVDDIQKHTDALMVEIQTLNEMIRAKEIEWNNMIHLKKVKEEILLRLTRKKHVLDVMETKLGEVSEYTHFDSSNLTNVRSASVGPRPPTPPPEVDIRPASVTPLHSSTLNTSNKPNVSSNSISGSRLLPGSKDNSLFAQFNHSNSSVTMVPLSTSSSSLITSTNTILQSRANMKSSEVAKEKPNAAQIQRQILPKPVLSNHQQILNNLAMSAGLTAAGAPSTGATSISTSSTTATVASAANILAGLSNNILAHTAALLNGHHHPSASNHLTQSQVNQLQVGRQGVIKDVKSIIADYRQKHPEQVPRRGRRLKNIPSSGYEGITITNKSGSSRMPELGFLLGENSRPSSNDSSQSNSNQHPNTVAGGALSTSPPSGHHGGGFSINDVLAQFAKMSQADRNLLSNLGAATAAAAAAAAAAVSSSNATSSTTTHSSSSSRQQQQQQQQSQQNSSATNLSKNSYPEVTLHPVMNSNSGAGSGADMNHSAGSNTSAANQSQNNNSNNSTNSLLHGILTKSSSRPNASGFTSFSPTLARLLTAPERMSSQAATVTSGALANLQANTGLNLSKSNSEITITPVVGSNLQQSILAHQQQLQEQQKQLQRLREQHFMNMDDEADESVDRLVIDEGDDHHGTANNSRNDGHRDSSGVVITTRGGNGPEFHENDVPECQGCKKREAQFVCAGCGNQWYCSRECQVNAWDDHSEVCTG